MNLIEHATHAENTIAQLTTRIETLAAEHASALEAKNTEIATLTTARDEAVKLLGVAETDIRSRDAYLQQIEAKIVTLDDLREKLAEKTAFQATMEQRVTAVLQSADPAQYEALAVDFLTPAKDKEKAEKRAKAKALRAEAKALEDEIE